jgi:hypothetical protein
LKRAASILLLVIFLFNVGGYYIVFWGLRQQSDLTLTQRLDEERYSKEEVIELKIPVALPYPIQTQEFERINGRFEHNGEFYKLVKQKLENDTLYVVCFKDHHEKKLVKTMTDYVKITNDLPASSKKAINFLGKLVKDFTTSDTDKILHQAGWSMKFSFNTQSFPIRVFDASIPSPPPKA